MKEIRVKGRVLEPISPGIWRIEKQGKMKASVHLVGSDILLSRLTDDLSVEQAIAVAMLPGVVDPVLAMPDIHQGYGFPIGGVAAFRWKDGIVSPGGVGYDINCGVRLLTSPWERKSLVPHLKSILAELFETIPCGVGSRRSDLGVGTKEWSDLLINGSRWAVGRGFGTNEDLETTESRGRIFGADPDAVSTRAKERGENQVGTLGSGNHFVEVQYVDEIYDNKTAEVFGLRPEQVVVTIHTGSRGLGYQVCQDYLESTYKAGSKYGLEIAHRELASAPLNSPEGRAYLGAMSAAANFAFANRQIISHWVREVFRREVGVGEMPLLYDVCHNIAKKEQIPGIPGDVCVHRKGATRAYPPEHPELTPRYRKTGQPVFVPGDMGRYSFVLAGNPGSLEKSFGSACHGAGRVLSRTQAKKRGKGRALVEELKKMGVLLKAAGRQTAVEEMPEAYKDVSEVVRSVEDAGIARPVARLRPLAVVKG